jgi:hypothetical protein
MQLVTIKMVQKSRTSRKCHGCLSHIEPGSALAKYIYKDGRNFIERCACIPCHEYMESDHRVDDYWGPGHVGQMRKRGARIQSQFLTTGTFPLPGGNLTS